VREYRKAVFNKLGTEPAYPLGGGSFLAVYLYSFVDQRRFDFLNVPAGLRRLPHAFQGEKKIAGGGAGGGDSLHDAAQVFEELDPVISLDIEGAQGYRIGSGYPDGRCPPDSQFFDSRSDIPVVVELQVGFFKRKTCLVDYPDTVAEPFQGQFVYFYLPPYCQLRLVSAQMRYLKVL
jgi:hypothetical protein